MNTQTQQCFTVAAITLAALTLTTSARADAVVDWNIVTGQTIPFATRPGGTPGLDYAMVHAAIHDAVQAYDRRFEPYAVEITGASGSPVAAIAKAAHDVLVARFPAKMASLDATSNAPGLRIDDGTLAGRRYSLHTQRFDPVPRQSAATGFEQSPIR